MAGREGETDRNGWRREREKLIEMGWRGERGKLIERDGGERGKLIERGGGERGGN